MIDADRIAHEVTGPDEPATAILSGSATTCERPTGPSTGRRSVGSCSATWPLRDLEAIVHPAVRPRIVAAVRAAEVGAEVVVARGHPARRGRLRAECDEVWLVVCDGADQRSRLRDRGLPDEVVEQRIAARG